jgi:uncharacterized protein with PIN domain
MKFILTPELGRLAKWLRILGFDAAYFPQVNFAFLLVQALRDNRIILTRNSRFINKVRMTRFVHVNSDHPVEQLKQVCKELDIKPNEDAMFSRCIICNTQLRQVNKQEVQDRVPKYVFNTQDDFFACSCCQRVYWQGTHWGNVAQILGVITESLK